MFTAAFVKSKQACFPFYLIKFYLIILARYTAREKDYEERNWKIMETNILLAVLLLVLWEYNKGID